MFNLNDIMFFEADDHYTHIRSSFGNKILVPFNLGSIEKNIKENFPYAVNIVRMGRKFIINTRCIYHINATKQTVSLSDYHGRTLTLSVSKPVLRNLMEAIKSDSDYVIDANDKKSKTKPKVTPSEEIDINKRGRITPPEKLTKLIVTNNESQSMQ